MTEKIGKNTLFKKISTLCEYSGKKILNGFWRSSKKREIEKKVNAQQSIAKKKTDSTKLTQKKRKKKTEILQ